jgi:hypothetical protein
MELLCLGRLPKRANEGGIEHFDVQERCRGWKQQGIVVEKEQRGCKKMIKNLEEVGEGLCKEG